MNIWSIVGITVTVTLIGIFSLLIIKKRSDKIALELYLDKMVKSGNIVLPDCGYAHECFLYELTSFDKLPDCGECRYLKQNVSKFDRNIT